MTQETRILVTGANGRLGRAVMAALTDLNPCGVAREMPRIRPNGVDGFAVGPLNAETDWSVPLSGVTHVIHCAALTYLPDSDAANTEALFQTINVAGTIALAQQAVKAGVRRLIYISSMTVNGKHSPDNGVPFRHTDAANPQSAYSRSKWDAEQALLKIADETGLEIVIVRIPRIVWPELTGNLALLAKLVTKGLPLPFGLITRNGRDNISAPNLITALRVCATHPAAANQTFLISDQNPLSTRDLVIALGARLGQRPRLIPVPAATLRFIVMALPAKLLGKMNRQEMLDELLLNLRIDASHFQTRTDWKPDQSLVLALSSDSQVVIEIGK